MVGVHSMKRQFRRHVSFGMRGSSSIKRFVVTLAKNHAPCLQPRFVSNPLS